MADEVKGTRWMICRTCGHQLDKLTRDGITFWGHAVELLGKSDHEVDPVEYDESILVSVCDFCHADVPLEERHYLPVSNYDIIVELASGEHTSLGNRGGFNCCLACEEYVAVQDWDGLADRYVKLHPGTHRETLQFLWDVMRPHIQGPVRKWRPGDELAGGD